MIDLHMHSTCSDGSFTPAELVREGAARGLTAMALTDHDTVAGVREFVAAAEAAGIRAVSGVEISADTEYGTVHILAYGVALDHEAFNEHLDRVLQGRMVRNRLLVERLRSIGIDITLDEVAARSGGDVVARPHFAQVLVEKGYARDKRDAFDHYLARGRPGYVERERIPAAETLQAIREAGGVSVLAHPFCLRMGEAAIRSTVEQLAAMGLTGLEAYYADHDGGRQAWCLRVAGELGLIVTGGSDFHGKLSPGVVLGRGRGDLEVPDRVMDDLLERVAAVRGAEEVSRGNDPTIPQGAAEKIGS